MVAPIGNGSITNLVTPLSLLYGIEINVVGNSIVLIKHFRIRREYRRKSRVMPSAVAPFRMPRFFGSQAPVSTALRIQKKHPEMWA